MENYNKLRRPPKTALRQIEGGRLSGKTDISPQWRYEIMTEVFGECGTGWKFKIERMWTEPGADGVVFAFAQIGLQVMMEDGQWSEPTPGVGGHQMVVKESAGLYNNDEAFKMAVTDALGTAMKMLGVAADIYSGLWDGSKYTDSKPAKKTETKKTPIQEMLTRFTKAKPRLNKHFGDDSIYYAGLENLGVKHANKIKKVAEGEKCLDWYLEMVKESKDDKNTKASEAPGDDGNSFPLSED